MMRLCARRGIASLTRRRNLNHHCLNLNYGAGFLSQIRSEGIEMYQCISHRSLSTSPPTEPKNERPSSTNNNSNNNKSSNINNNNHRQSGTAKSKIKEMEQQVNHFRQRLFNLPPLPPIWSASESSINVDPGYQRLVQDTRSFVDRLQQTVEQGQLDKRFTREVSFLLEHALFFFRTSFQDCERVLFLAKKWNLDITNQQPALEAACMEGRWKEASRLFSQQVDPDMAGYTPMEINVKQPLGLYAIARDAQERDSPVAEQVMDAVMSMSMVNPTDQNKYVLAAGSALGRVGAWEELIDYQENSYNSTRLGQPLIGAAMYACILCGRPEEALKQFAKLTDGPASVGSAWQWGGGADVIDPVVRDIAMGAGGSQSLELFWQAKEEGFQVSSQALLAVIEACSAISDVLAIVDHLCDGTTWLVDGDDLNIVRCDEQERAIKPPSEHLEAIVLPIMRHCNHAGEFGISLLVYEMLVPSHQNRSEGWQNEIFHRLSICSHRDETLAAIMTAMCGLESSSVACGLFEAVADGNHDDLPFSFDIYQYATSILSSNDRWVSAHEMMTRLVDVVGGLPDKTLTLSQTELLLAALAKTAQACNGASQPEAAIFLLRHVQKRILHLQEVKPSMEGAVRSFLGIDEEGTPDYTLLARSDPLLAESLRAHRLRGSTEQALSLLETVLEESKQPYESMPLSVNEALHVLLDEGRAGEAMELFQSLDKSVWMPDMFVTLAKALEKEQRWSSIGDLYHLSLKSGCLTEDMGIVAMKAVVETPDLEGKIRLLRGIIKDMCSLTGMVENEWQYSRYWLLKKSLGIRYSRLIMWWNDQRTSDLYELQLAIEQFTERKAAGLRPKNDVLRAIVRHCQHYRRLAMLINELEMTLPAEKEVWTDLLVHVIVELQNTTLRNDKRFVEEVILALRTVDAHAECEEFLSEALTRGVRVDRSLLSNS